MIFEMRYKFFSKFRIQALCGTNGTVLTKTEETYFVQ